MTRIKRLYDEDQEVIRQGLGGYMTRIRRLYDKDQEIIIIHAFIEPSRFFNQFLDWGEFANLEFGNKIVSPGLENNHTVKCCSGNFPA